ncbi:dihydroorotase, mitochondrial-like [Raphanus sativus]|uniref:dihydroorotase n=1 Tax=Raphanus sativus TaxID=3726 RepID=A0A9W3CZD6_RAPSA|nr:dihydroorotase, mitochondrial-like [Raphanus sativus]XP_056856826.1 dihydroorotase, mitochondrial-like [Raphanus sativus]
MKFSFFFMDCVQVFFLFPRNRALILVTPSSLDSCPYLIGTVGISPTNSNYDSNNLLPPISSFHVVCGCNSHTTTSPSQQKRSFPGGLHPYNYCLPVLKREIHREAIVKAVTSGSKKFFLGTDSAPHERRRKESSCGCAGIYSAPVALSLYAKVFDEAGALDKLEAFTSFNGPDFYGLPRNSSKITLKKAPWKVPEVLTFSFGEIVPMFAGETLQWQPSFE